MNRSRTLRAALLAPAVALSIGGAFGAAPAFAQTGVDAKPPVFVDQAGTSNDSYVVPDTPGVNYYVDSVKVNPGTRQVDPAKPFIEVFTAAAPGFTLNEPATWSHQYSSGNESQILVDGKKVNSLQDGLDIQAGKTPTPTPSTTASASTTTSSTSTSTAAVAEKDIAACKDLGRTDIPRGDALYSAERDRDNDGTACESGASKTTDRNKDELPPTGIEDAVPLALGALAAAGFGGLLLRRRNDEDAAA